MFVQAIRKKPIWFLSILVGVASAGCAAIVGADDYSVDKTSTGTGGATGGGAGGSQGPGGKGGAAGATGGSGGVGGTTPPPDGGRSGMAGGVAPGQDGGRDAPSPTGAGETLCTGNTCPAGQSCLVTAFSPPGLCTYSCDTAACDADHDCIRSNRAEDMFPSSCVRKCPGGAGCPAGLLCIPISTGSVCLPVMWFDGLGIGDDCFADVQCNSGLCRNKPAGWCSKPCGPADALCAHDPTSVVNRNGEVNWCVNNLGALSCVPGCDGFGAQTCMLYPGTTCRPITDITNTAGAACLP